MALASAWGMPKVLRSCLLVALCLVGALRADAATVTIAWNANSEPDIARYFVGYRTTATGAETLVGVGLVTTWSLTTATAGNTYYFRVYAENQSGLRSAPSAEVSTTLPTTTPPPSGGGYSVERGRLSFSAVKSGATVVIVDASPDHHGYAFVRHGVLDGANEQFLASRNADQR